MSKVRLPHRFWPREYQMPLFAEMGNRCKRGIICWHRRAGKDLTCFNLLILRAYQQRGVYWYCFPEYAQGRKALWEGHTKDGLKYLSCVPEAILGKPLNHQEMRIELANGSIIRIVGADRYNKLVGAGPRGMVFSEFSITAPSAWSYLRPMLEENDGWVLFNGTPRGENHFYDMLQMAKNNPDWFWDVRTVDDTGVITRQQIDQIRMEGESEEKIQQEYYCSFEGSTLGSYYGQELRVAKQEKRITSVPYNPDYPVETYWDLGYNDQTTIWFIQKMPGGTVHVIDYFWDSQKVMAQYAAVIHNKNYNYGKHLGPHDSAYKSRQTGKSDIQILQDHGVYMEAQPRPKNQEDLRAGRDAVRAVLKRCWFDAEKCHDGIEALKHYRREYDEDKRIFKDKAVHDWASHGADAFRCFAVDDRTNKNMQVPPRVKRSSYV